MTASVSLVRFGPGAASRAPRLASPARSAGAALALALAAAFAPAAGAANGAEAARPAELPLFVRPAVEASLAEARRLVSDGDLVGAEIELAGVARRHPGLTGVRLALARLTARRGRPGEALAHLRAAAETGLRGAGMIAALPEFAPLTGREDWPALAEALSAPPPPDAASPRRAAVPAPLIEGAAFVAEGNAEWSDAEGAIRAYVAGPDAEIEALRAAGPPELVTARRDDAGRLVNRWFAEGRAAGNRGDLYENRDDDHSNLDLGRFPQITPLEHGQAAVAARWHRGVAQDLLLDFGGRQAPPMIGNSSTAVVSGPLRRSMARLALTTDDGPARLARLYAANRLYVYPEHEDHDPFFGDLFHAATPYMIVTQGSSFSDRPALEALALALAALRPETKARLIEARLIAPTLQMLWRRAQAGIADDAAYLSPAAHPTVFDPERIEPERLVRHANALSPETIPPAVALRVLREDAPVRGVTLFGDGLSERLFDTPGAIARAFRRTDATLRLTVSAAATADPNGRPLSFRWRLLRGDPARVTITPLGARGEAAEIEVAWHEETRTPLRDLRSLRVDVGVFADNGAELSAPAFVSVAFPPRQARARDAEGRLEMIDYDAPTRQETYSDPELWPLREWRDVYAWDEAGRPLGWRREGGGGVARFTRHGARALERDDLGRPTLAERTAYPMLPDGDARRRVTPRPGGARLAYSYAGPADRQGVARPAPEGDAEAGRPDGAGPDAAREGAAPGGDAATGAAAE